MMLGEESKKCEGPITPQQILTIGEKDSKFESPIALNLDLTTKVFLPSLKWNNGQEKPRLMKITNTGESVILSAKWFSPRPFITKGPFLDCYVFSQVHFHWGKNDNEGSEHRIDDNSLPLEIHVMFFKSLYLSQEEAMKNLDGVTVMAYFAKIHDDENVKLKPIIDALEKIRHPFTSHHMDPLSLEQLMTLFTDDYFMYWGNVAHAHKILWLICRQPITISPKQICKFRSLLDKKRNLMMSNFRDVKSLNNRVIFHVNPGHERSQFLIRLPHEKPVVTKEDIKSTNRKSMKKKSIKSKKSIKKSIKKQSIKRKSSVKRKKSQVQANYVTIDNDPKIFAEGDSQQLEIGNKMEAELEAKKKFAMCNSKLKLLEEILAKNMLENVILEEQENCLKQWMESDSNEFPLMSKFGNFFKKVMDNEQDAQNSENNENNQPKIAFLKEEIIESINESETNLISEEPIESPPTENIEPQIDTVNAGLDFDLTTTSILRPNIQIAIKKSLEKKGLLTRQKHKTVVQDIFQNKGSSNQHPVKAEKKKSTEKKPLWKF